MKFSSTSTTALFTLLTLSAAAPNLHARQQSQDNIISSVTSWENDVVQVNSFLNSASGLSGDALVSAAQTALGFATDEPIQLGIESTVPGLSADGLAAAATLMGVFQKGVLDQLNVIINNPDNSDMVNSAIDAINVSRCLFVLPSVDILWPAALSAVGVAENPPPVAQLENACAKIAL